MTQKDYIKFAKLIAGELALAGDSAELQSYKDVRLRTIYNIKCSIADIFAHDNPRFNRQKFYRACEPKKVVTK